MSSFLFLFVGLLSGIFLLGLAWYLRRQSKRWLREREEGSMSGREYRVLITCAMAVNTIAVVWWLLLFLFFLG
jgi:sterol desaturase/sphingolipid hydroxylase (fatty acid hydroxylase superfamily)